MLMNRMRNTWADNKRERVRMGGQELRSTELNEGWLTSWGKLNMRTTYRYTKYYPKYTKNTDNDSILPPRDGSWSHKQKIIWGWWGGIIPTQGTRNKNHLGIKVWETTKYAQKVEVDRRANRKVQDGPPRNRPDWPGNCSFRQFEKVVKEVETNQF